MIIVIDASAGIEIVLERLKSSVFNQKILSARNVRAGLKGSHFGRNKRLPGFA
jgi:hypothetical protein